ncbi:MAG: phosphatidylserine decarboxylase [Alphaproteobacteria bacterium]|nr:phosphatidylserine decarboxylase [Alphaproteobacteria bacterium]
MAPLNPLLYFHRAGWPFMAITACVAFLLFFVGGFVSFAAFVLAAWCFYFFRNPDRTTPARKGLVVSPADGRVVAVKDVIPETELGLGSAPRTRISIFLSIFNVHINRIPADGEIVLRRYRPGKFFNASLDKASVDNERMALVLKLDGGHPFEGTALGVVQIAGLIARRIVCDAQIEQKVKAGERYGLIRFGSRTDVYLPPGAKPLVSVGQTMIGGETVLSDLCSEESPRTGEVRP